MKNRNTKGDYLYLQNRKKMEIIKTILFFAVSGALFIIGFLTTKTKANYFTIIAVLGCLPASKSAVSMIMNLKIKGCSEINHKKIIEKFGEGVGAYNLYFTSYDKNYDISHLFVKGKTVIAFTEDLKIVENSFEEHIKNRLVFDSIKDVNVKLYKNIDKYMERMVQMQNLENEKNKEGAILKTLYSVSL